MHIGQKVSGDTVRVASGVSIPNGFCPLKFLTIWPNKSHIAMQTRHQCVHIPMINGPIHPNNQGLNGLLVRSLNQKCGRLWYGRVHTKSANNDEKLTHSDST